ncbi:MAG: peptidase U32 family protein [Thermosulfidibacteraceae bacterium]|mgnify:CR=1 FL=1|jgi:putative protease
MRYEIIVPARSLRDIENLVELPIDAFYAGIHGWSRSARSHELSFEELRVLRDITYSNNKKLYLSFNTIVGSFEYDSACKLLLNIMERISPDALILNDVSLVSFSVKRGWEVHVSLGGVIINSKDVEFWSDIGVTRIVVSPHLGIEEIEELLNVNENIEVMIYGVRCNFTYTGICRMSSYFDLVMRTTLTRFMIWEGSSKRSGICFKPCAQEWLYNNERLKIEPLSYMCYNVAQLASIGVKYFKIGGRGLSFSNLKEVVYTLKALLEGGKGGRICTFNTC